MTANPCQAQTADGVTSCARCGLEWLAAAAPPPCDPIIFAVIRQQLADDLARAEASLLAVVNVGLGPKALPTDGGVKARRLLAVRGKALAVFERICGDKDLKAAVNKGAKT